MDADALQIRQALMKSLRAEFQKQEMRDKQNKELSTQTIKFLKQLSSGDGGTMALSAHFDDYVTYEKERNKITDKWEKRTVVLLEDILDALLESCGCKKERQSGGGGVGFGLGLVGAEIYEMMKNIGTAVRKAATNIEKDAEKEFEELKNTVDNEFKGISDGASKEIKSLKDSAVSDFKKIRTAIEDEIDKVLKKLGLQPSTPDAKPSPKPGILPKIEGGIKNALENPLGLIKGAIKGTAIYTGADALEQYYQSKIHKGEGASATAGATAAGGLKGAEIGSIAGPEGELLGALIGAVDSLNRALGINTGKRGPTENRNSTMLRTGEPGYIHNSSYESPLSFDTLYVDNLVVSSGNRMMPSVNTAIPRGPSIVQADYTTGDSNGLSNYLPGWSSEFVPNYGLSSSATDNTSPGYTPSVSDNSGVLQDIGSAANGDFSTADFLTKLAGAESGFKPSATNSKSTAKGAFQIIDPTAKSLIDKYGQRFGITQDNYDSSNVVQQAKLAGAWRADTISSDNSMGIDPSDSNLYTQWMMGGPQLIQADKNSPNAIAAKLFPSAASANPNIFYNKDHSPKTVDQVYNTVAGRFNSQPDFASALVQAENAGTYDTSSAVASSSPSVISPSDKSNEFVPSYTPSRYLGNGATSIMPTIDDIPMGIFDPSMHYANSSDPAL